MLRKIKSFFIRKKLLTPQEVAIVLEILAERTEELRIDVTNLEQRVDSMRDPRYNLNTYTLGK